MLLHSRIVHVLVLELLNAVFLAFLFYFFCLFYFQSSRVTFVTVGAWTINGDGSSTFLDRIL